ncbi:MAG TPA: acyl-CoA synthetase, partial [Actinobacteria bacterium]|nr:acyl-CoA synthetase [Actinomycetota bacterium]
MVTTSTGTSLQRLAEQSWDRTGAESLLFYEGTRWTGAQLAERARRLTGGLTAAGLRPGDRVLICMANCPEVSVTYHAAWRAGAVTTPVLFLLSEDELRHVLRDSGAAMAVTTPEFLPKVLAAGVGLDSLRAVVVAGEAAPSADGPALLSFADLEGAAEAGLVDSDPAGLAALLYTGGTTGRSKGVMISHDALSSSAWAATAASYDPALRSVLLPLPLSHVYGLMVSVMSLHAPDPGTSVLMR